MLPSVRKDLEELEARLDLMLNKQVELETALNSLRVHLTAVVQGETNNLGTDVAQNFDAQNRWIAAKFSESRVEIMEQGALDKTENIAAIVSHGTRQHQQIESLRAQFAEQLRMTQARQDEIAGELAGRLDEFEAAWRERTQLEIDDVSPQSAKAWSESVGTRLKRFGEAQGMPRSFAWQLLQELKELTELNRQFDDENIAWADRLDELQHILFASDRAMPWTCLTPHNATPAQRRELRVLETAVAQMRAYVQENLLRATGIRPLEIVPRISPFDASVHESNEFLEVPTTEASKHNVILSVEGTGFQQISPWGDAQLLRPARVRRYVLQNESVAAEESSAGELLGEEDVPSVSGQL